MKMLLRVAAVYLALGASHAIAEVEITAQKEFQDWSVFVDGGDCWIASYPKPKITNEKDKIYYFVTFHQGEPIPEFRLLQWVISASERSSFLLLEAKGLSFPFRKDQRTHKVRTRWRSLSAC